LGVLAIAIIALVSSCEPEAVLTPPNITVSPLEDGTTFPGDTVKYEMIVSSDTDLVSVSFEATIDGVIIAAADTLFPASTQNSILNFVFVIPEDLELGSQIKLDFDANNLDAGSTASRFLTVERAILEISHYTAVIMADLENPNGSSFFSLDDNSLMTLVQARENSDKVDLIYYFGNINQATLCAATDEDVKVFTDVHENSIVDGLTTKNATELALTDVTSDDFAAITDDSMIHDNTPTEVFTAVAQLAVGQVIFAKTVTGKKALVLVQQIDGGQGTSEITIEVKIQK